jgi:ABC-type multidrug transport system fused ATPase/permease subunit
MRRVLSFLREQGTNAWVDNEKLIPGTPAWKKAVEKAIKEAAAFVVLLSPASNISDWVGREISFAETHKKTIFPIHIYGDEKDAIPLTLVDHQRIDIRQNEEIGLKNLHLALAAHLKTLEVLERIEIEKTARAKAERERLEREEKARKEKEAADQAVREKAAREKAERDARLKAALEEIDHKATERSAREKKEREAAERAARKQAELETAKKTTGKNEEQGVLTRMNNVSNMILWFITAITISITSWILILIFDQSGNLGTIIAIILFIATFFVRSKYFR